MGSGQAEGNTEDHVQEGGTYTQSMFVHVDKLYEVMISLPTIAEEREANHISSVVCNKDSDEGHVQDHTLHQHPHEGH